jgi:hypothetical protein
MSADVARDADLGRAQRAALLVGAIGLVAGLIGAVAGARQFFEAYLIAYVFWLGIALGCVALAMVHHLVGGVWGYLLRRALEAGAMTVPLMAILFVPLLLGLHDLYRWTDAGALAASETLRHKRPYLNIPFFVARAALYFAVWSALAWLLNRWSREHDRTADPALLERLRRLSAGGLVLYAVTITFAAIDWLMSLEPEWYSTVFGFLIMTSQGLATFAFAIVAAILLARYAPLAALLTEPRLNDLGSLLLTAVLLWAYMAFAQFLIIWAGNLPRENVWYRHRTVAGWRWLTVALIVVHFCLPFAVLLFRRARGGRVPLAVLGCLILAMQLLYTFWLVAPAFQSSPAGASWLDAVLPLGIGGVWLGAFVWWLRRGPLLPRHLLQRGEGVEVA